MTGDPRLAPLVDLGLLVLEASTSELRKAAAARDRVQDQLRGLDRNMAEAASSLAVAQAAHCYEIWAAERRAELNAQLASRQAAWMNELDAARHAFGRAQMLTRIAKDPWPRR